MKRYFSLLVCTLTAVLLPALLGAQDFEMEGTWTAYTPSQLPDYTLREHENSESSDDLALGQVTFEGDGSVESDFLPHTDWETDDGFLLLTEDDLEDFYAVRNLTQNVYVLVNLTVTEQNRQIINIRVHRADSLLLIRE